MSTQTLERLESPPAHVLRIVALGYSEAANKLLLEVASSQSWCRLSCSAQNWDDNQHLEKEPPDVLISAPGALPAGLELDPQLLLLSTESSALRSEAYHAGNLEEVKKELAKEFHTIYQAAIVARARQLQWMLARHQAGLNLRKYAVDVSGRQHGRDVRIPIDQIEWIEGAGNWSHVHANGGCYEVRELISQIIAELPPAQFLRIHRSIVVNTSHITQVTVRNNFPIAVQTRSGATLTVGITFRGALLETELADRLLREPSIAR